MARFLWLIEGQPRMLWLGYIAMRHGAGYTMI